MDITKIIENLPKYAQVLHNDCIMNLVKDENIAHPLRKELILSMVTIIREHLNSIEQHMQHSVV